MIYVFGIVINLNDEIVGFYTAKEIDFIYPFRANFVRKNELAKMIQEGEKIYTIMWNYKLGRWEQGSEVELYGANAVRTDANERLTDNLYSLPTFMYDY